MASFTKKDRIVMCSWATVLYLDALSKLNEVWKELSDVDATSQPWTHQTKLDLHSQLVHSVETRKPFLLLTCVQNPEFIYL